MFHLQLRLPLYTATTQQFQSKVSFYEYKPAGCFMAIQELHLVYH